MNNLSKVHAIFVGIVSLGVVLLAALPLINTMQLSSKRAAEAEARKNSTPAMVVDPKPEWNVAIDCPKYFDDYNRAGKYEEIGTACFDYFNITDEMLERRLQKVSYERELNPCNN